MARKINGGWWHPWIYLLDRALRILDQPDVPAADPVAGEWVHTWKLGPPKLATSSNSPFVSSPG